MPPLSPKVTVKDLLAVIRRGGDAAHEAALTLGLLIENRPAADNAATAAIVPELAARRFSIAERAAAVDGLIDYLQDTVEPHSMALWALTKSYESRAVPVFIAQLDRTLNDSRAVHLAYQALIGVITTGLTTPKYRKQSLAALRRVATQGHADVAETARSFLRSALRKKR